MLYRPGDPNLGIWDAVVFPHEGRYHLFHLQCRVPHHHDQLGHLVSEDMIHWDVQPTIYLRGEPGAWDGRLHETGLRTGFFLRVPEGFAMAYGTVHDGREVVGMAFSGDLIHWDKYTENPVLCPSGTWYEHDPKQTAMFWIHWRDPFIEAVEGGYEALLCGRIADGEHGVRACVARAFSPDLLNWQPRSPLVAPGRYNSMECPERFEMDGRWYLTFSTGTEWGRPLSTPTRKETHGGYYLISDDREGPYRVPEDDLLIGAQLLSYKFEANTEYAVRSVIGPDGRRLLYGQNPGQRTAISTPKVLEADSQGLLQVKFWEKLLCLETGEVSEGFDGLQTYRMGNVALGEWETQSGRAVGRSGGDAAIATLPGLCTDVHWTCEVTQHSGERFALLVRVNDNLAGTAIVFDFRENTISLAGAGRGNQFGLLFTHYDTIHRPLALGRTYALRILARDEFVEAYLDDVLLFSASQRKHAREGRLGLAVLGEATFSRNRAASLSPLP